MSDINLNDLVLKTKDIIVEAGTQIRSAWNSTIVAHTKLGADIVTDVDVEVETGIREKLSKLRSDIGFIVEEGVCDSVHEYNWSIDPIDGTKYFAHNVPMFYTQIALLKGLNTIFAYTYQPISRQLFFTRKHYGAFLNDSRLSIPAENTPMNNTVIDIDTGDMRGGKNAWKKSVINCMASNCYRLRMSGGYLGPTLATGAVQAYVNIDLENPPSTKNILDLSPHQLLVEEAGYTVTHYTRLPQTVMIWSDQATTSEIITLLDLV